VSELTRFEPVLPYLTSLLPGLATPGEAFRAQVGSDRVLLGHVTKGEEPLADGKVVLHAVSATSGREIDSVALESDGSFRLLLPEADNPEDVYFASIEHLGVLYLGGAVTRTNLPDSGYAIHVYDTLVAPADGSGGEGVELHGRTLFLERLPAGGPIGESPFWRITEALEIDNHSGSSLVSDGASPTWSIEAPIGAQALSVGHGEGQGTGITLENGRVALWGPLTPGERLLVVSYLVDEALPGVPDATRADRLEVLLREPEPLVGLEGLELVGPTEVGSVTYRGYAAQPATSSVRMIRVEPPSGLPAAWIAVAVAVALSLVWVAREWQRRREEPQLGFWHH